MTGGPRPSDLVDPDDLDTPKGFAEALGALQRRLGMTISELAQKARIEQDVVNDLLRARRLPGRSELQNLLLALGVRDRHRQDDWELALVRAQGRRPSSGAERFVDALGDPLRDRIRPYVLEGSKTGSSHEQDGTGPSLSGEDDQVNLLLRIYIPSARLYAGEASRLLSLFREWLTTTRGYGVRQSGYHTASGDMYEFFVDASVVQTDLREEFDNFSDFLTLCSEDAPAATDVLTSAGIDRTSSVKLVARFGREVQRLQLDLRHDREQRMLTIRQSLEEELLEGGVDLRDIPRSQLNALIENHVPGPSAPESLTLLATPWTAGPAAPVTVNINPQIITVIRSKIMQNVEGTIHLGLQAQELLSFIQDFGGQEAATLQSAVYELEDEAAPPAAKSNAKQRLKKFVSQVTEAARDVGIELLADYLKSKGM